VDKPKEKARWIQDGEYSPKKEISRNWNWGKSRSFDSVEIRSLGICGEDGVVVRQAAPRFRLVVLVNDEQFPQDTSEWIVFGDKKSTTTPKKDVSGFRQAVIAT
jgi:hypothetical protein